MNTGTTVPTDTPAVPAGGGRWLPEIAVFVAAVSGRMPALGAWWNLDDWGQLARAAGLDAGAAASGWPARLLSQHIYWDLTWPLFGLNSDAHALLRLALHGLAAVLVVRIAARGGLGPLSRLLAGLVFAASPLAFTPLYWASGIQEILAAVFALAAVERWLAAPSQGRRQLAWASVLAALSMFSKESALGLPLLFLVFAWLRVGVRLEDKAADAGIWDIEHECPAAAFAMSQLDNDPEMPRPMGIFRRVSNPTLDQLIHEQVTSVTDTRGIGHLEDLIYTPDAWKVD